MTRNKILLFLSMGFAFWLSFPSSSATADCYTDCMDADGCGVMGFNTDAAYCSDVQARCSSDCLHGGNVQSYGAIAYSAQDGAYGYSDGWQDQASAERTAMNYCSQNGNGCEVQVWFYNSCGAVAADGYAVAWGQNDSEEEARRIALNRCAQAGGQNCEIQVSHCSK